jgi:hypothetical protein
MDQESSIVADSLQAPRNQNSMHVNCWRFENAIMSHNSSTSWHYNSATLYNFKISQQVEQ